MTLKEKLLYINLVIDNEYLDKYCELIECHKNNKQIKYKTNRHHIIPQSYYNHYKLKIDNTSDNIVNLNIRDHCLAHYLLAKCSKEKYFTHANSLAVERIINNRKKFNIDKITYDEIILLINELNTEGCRKLTDETVELIKIKTKEAMNNMKNRECLAYWKNKKQSKESNEKRSKTNSQFRWVHKNGISKFVKGKELEELLSQGFEYGSDKHFNRNRKHSDESKQHMGIANKEVWNRPGYREKMSNILKGRIWITNGNTNKKIYPKDFENYKQLGYRRGRTSRC